MKVHCQQTGEYLHYCAEALSVSIERVLQRAGLSESVLLKPYAQVPAHAQFSLWMALVTEADRPDAELILALAAARGPVPPPMYALSCADTLALGLIRFSLLKTAVGPVTLIVRQSSAGVKIITASTDDSAPLPARLGLAELLYITECVRQFSGKHIVPEEIILPTDLSVATEVAEYLGCTPSTGDEVALVFSAEDAARPLVSCNPPMWHALEHEFAKQLVQVNRSDTLTVQVRSILNDSLAGGDVSSETVAKRLCISKRSLQRGLAEEGSSFKALLAETRQLLAEHYLRHTDLGLSEIAILLGFGSTTSFLRAYKGWTGHTPGTVRNGSAYQAVAE